MGSLFNFSLFKLKCVNNIYLPDLRVISLWQENIWQEDYKLIESALQNILKRIMVIVS